MARQIDDDAVFDAILAEIAEHGESQRAYRKHKVNPEAFYRRVNRSEVDRKRWLDAKAAGCHAYAEETLRRQHVTPPKIATHHGTRVDPGWVQWQRNVIDARKWHLAKMLPRMYGERTTIAGDADNPLAVADVTDAKSALLRGLTPKPDGSGEGGES